MARTTAFDGKTRGGTTARSFATYVKTTGPRQRLRDALVLRAPRRRPHPVDEPAIGDEADAVLAREVRRRQRRRRAGAEVERGPRRAAHLGERVEHQHHVGVALPVPLRHVERAQTQGGAPVHLSHAIAGRERTDVAGLDALTERGRDVVADRCARVQGGGRPGRGVTRG